MTTESHILRHNVLYLPDREPLPAEYLSALNKFCGIIARSKQELDTALTGCVDQEQKITTPQKRFIYLTGSLNDVWITALHDDRVLIVEECSWNYDTFVMRTRCSPTHLGMVPIDVHRVGVLFRSIAHKHSYSQMPNDDMFQRVAGAHNFQSLTESNKAGVALRKGIYLSEVSKMGDGTTFNLLRCSSNFAGPTDAFAEVDRSIISKANDLAAVFFSKPAELNHVLAQIYYNIRNADTEKESKATIKAHSDKTKDMPRNGLIAFFSCYDFSRVADVGQVDAYDFDVRAKKGGVSMLTQLRFILKDPAKYPQAERDFRVTLYPNSLFIISLEMNRLYQHEIRPAALSIDKLPTRMGYVMRCSNVKAVYRDKAYIIDSGTGEERELEPMTADEMERIKALYREENLSDQIIVYPPIYTSLNDGDYLRPTSNEV
jgi:hypothetical protein